MSPLFKGLAEADAARVAAYCRYRELEKGETLFREGDDAATFFVVARGRIKVFKESIDGRELIIKTMREGDLVGEAASLARVPYPATAQALENAAAVEIPRREFVDLITREPELALNIIAALSARLHQISAVLEKLTLKDVPARLASYLLEHAAAGRGAAHVELDVPGDAEPGAPALRGRGPGRRRGKAHSPRRRAVAAPHRRQRRIGRAPSKYDEP
jgi:CRP/FNR family transcriptional regulator